MPYVAGDASGVLTYPITANGRTIIWRNSGVGAADQGAYFVEMTAVQLGFNLSGGTATVQRSFKDKADPTDDTQWENMLDNTGATLTIVNGGCYAFVTKIPYIAVLMASGGPGINLTLKVS
jgi:hypothetical protein